MMEKRNAAYKNKNLCLLRRTLRLTQKEFIERFLSTDEGVPLMSVATYSNLESKDGARMTEVILAVSEKLGIDAMSFSMPPEEFAEKIHMLLPENVGEEATVKSTARKRNIDQLLNRLTMYFAEQIFEKKLKKGDKIESDRELAARLGVGRSAIREALKVLDVLGMIDIRPGQGTYISNNETNFFVIPLSWSLFLNGNQTDSIIEVRNLLEVKAAYLAAGNKSEENMNRLYEVSHNIHNAYMAQDYKAFLNSDLEFHICIAECSGNPVIYSMIQTISNLMRHVSGTGMVDADQLRAIYDEHQKIYGLILASDADGAAKAMEEHLKNSVARYNYR
ncbi:MAG: FadR/GntR family transcriptional regulator [Oliverpabstia sp.]